jgi:hypothetical protein
MNRGARDGLFERLRTGVYRPTAQAKAAKR